MRIIVTSAGRANGGGYGALLGFDRTGHPIGTFSGDARIVDPRGLALDPSGALVYLNSGDDRVLALDREGRVVRDSGRIRGLDPGGGTFGPDGRYYAGTRHRRTILAMSTALDGVAKPFLPDGVVPFPRGFGFGRDGRLYLASGVGPSGEGDNTIVVFDRRGSLLERCLVADPQLSPLDLTLAHNGSIVVSSEYPFGAPDAAVSIRQYDPETGQLARVLVPGASIEFRRPRGLRFGADDRLYCVGEAHVIAFQFSTGRFLGPVVRLPQLNGQALLLLD